MTTKGTEIPIAAFISGRSGGKNESPQEQLPKMLRAIRTHLGMDIAFVSEFAHGRRYFRHIDTSLPVAPAKPGDSDPQDETYCQRVVDGRLPELIPDASLVPATQELPITAALPVGAHLSVPIRLKDGRIYGMFCCVSFTPDASLNERDVGMMKVFAELAAENIEEDLDASRLRTAMQERINSALAGDFLAMVYQPIYRVDENRIVGFESLARFASTPVRTPDVWFDEAAQVGLAIPLEIRAIRLALAGLEHLPGDVYVSVNLSPEVILLGDIEAALDGMALERIVLEVTEHAAIDRYADIAAVVGPMRKRGLRIAVDDAGAGYASFRHILSLTPDIIKLDVSITRDIDTDRSRRALASALIGFAHATNSKIVAEGVETAAELAVLRELGINKAQGYFLGKPMPLAAAVAALSSA